MYSPEFHTLPFLILILYSATHHCAPFLVWDCWHVIWFMNCLCMCSLTRRSFSDVKLQNIRFLLHSVIFIYTVSNEDSHCKLIHTCTVGDPLFPILSCLFKMGGKKLSLYSLHCLFIQFVAHWLCFAKTTWFPHRDQYISRFSVFVFSHLRFSLFFKQTPLPLALFNCDPLSSELSLPLVVSLEYQPLIQSASLSFTVSFFSHFIYT